MADSETPETDVSERVHEGSPLEANHAWGKCRDLERRLRAAEERISELRSENSYAESRAEAAELALEAATRDAERYRAGLQWYADQNHVLNGEDWDVEEGWLCGPEGVSCMIEPGSVANDVLNGRHLNPNLADENAELITIGPITSKSEHESAMYRICELMKADPAAGTAAGQELSLLAIFVEAYEKENFPLNAAIAQEQK